MEYLKIDGEFPRLSKSAVDVYKRQMSVRRFDL